MINEEYINVFYPNNSYAHSTVGIPNEMLCYFGGSYMVVWPDFPLQPS